MPTTSVSSVFFERFSILSPDFYQIDALDLAPRLLGKYLKRDDVVLQITEVSVYATSRLSRCFVLLADFCMCMGMQVDLGLIVRLFVSECV